MTNKRARKGSAAADGARAAETNGHASGDALASAGAATDADATVGEASSLEGQLATELEGELGAASDAHEDGAAESESAAPELDAAGGVSSAAGAAAATSAERLSGEELENAVLALLFASPDALSVARLSSLLPGVDADSVKTALAALAERMQLARLPLELRDLGGGWRVLTTPSMAWIVARLARARKTERISPAALETLAIVAYRQPVTKVEIEAIRGVQAGPVLRSLIDRRLLKVCGKADQPGSPLQYGTTRDFLDQFGLSSLKDLPRDAELVKD